MARLETVRAYILGALLAIIAMLGSLYLAPGFAFVTFDLEIERNRSGEIIIVQRREALYPINFFATWEAEVIPVNGDHVVDVKGCRGSGANSYTWGGHSVEVWRARVPVWSGDPDCVLLPGVFYIAECTWRFEALGIARSVTARSPQFVVGADDE